MGKWVSVKTTIELPDQLFRQAKAAAAERGVTLKDLFTEALRQRLQRGADPGAYRMPWEKAFGGLKDLRRENRRIERLIAAEFEVIDHDEWL